MLFWVLDKRLFICSNLVFLQLLFGIEFAQKSIQLTVALCILLVQFGWQLIMYAGQIPTGNSVVDRL